MENKIKDNALRIAELLGNEINISDVTNNRHISVYTSYNGLMPIVFECNNLDELLSINISFNNVELCIVGTYDGILIKSYQTELEFIEALQQCIIKYLEIKNENLSNK